MAIVVTTNTANVSSSDSNVLLYEAQGVLIGTTGPDTGIQMSGKNVAMTIHGGVFGSRIGIDTGSDKNGFLDGDNDITIGSTGTVDGGEIGIHMIEGFNRIINHGLISGPTAIAFDAPPDLDDFDTVENYGTIAGINIGIDATDGAGLLLRNHGVLGGQASIIGSSHGDEILNDGTVLGDVTLGAGDDTYEGAEGRVLGSVNLGEGNDRFIGGSASERVFGASGSDTIDLGGGDDTYVDGDVTIFSDGNDLADGGEGTDTYEVAFSFGSIINLEQGFASSAEAGFDTLISFENAIGSRSADTITGSAEANRLQGSFGNDVLDGLQGADRLAGGAGRDSISGGAGRDLMAGGADRDVFVFTSAAESKAGGGLRDVITDFVSGTDRIDLSQIDADRLADAPGNQEFHFIGASEFSSVAGELRFDLDPRSGNVVIAGDSNGDGRADFEIQLNHLGAGPVAADFIL